MKRTLATAAALAAVLATAAPAHADPALFTKAEFNAVHAGMTRADVESLCGCSGTLVAADNSRPDGSRTKVYWYANPIGGVVRLVYRQPLIGGAFKTWQEKSWCGSGDRCQNVSL